MCSGTVAIDAKDYFSPVDVSDVDLFTGWFFQQHEITVDTITYYNILKFAAWDFDVFKNLKWRVIKDTPAKNQKILEAALRCFSNAYCLSHLAWRKSRMEMANWLYGMFLHF